MGSFNEARDVRDDKAGMVVQGDDPQIGNDGGEGVVGNLGPGRGNAGNEARLAHVGVANQTDVGQELELQF